MIFTFMSLLAIAVFESGLIGDFIESVLRAVAGLAGFVRTGVLEQDDLDRDYLNIKNSTIGPPGGTVSTHWPASWPAEYKPDAKAVDQQYRDLFSYYVKKIRPTV